VAASSSNHTAACLNDEWFIVAVLQRPCTSVTHKPGDAAEAAAGRVMPGLVVSGRQLQLYGLQLYGSNTQSTGCFAVLMRRM
jgi:hypothetical protein